MDHFCWKVTSGLRLPESKARARLPGFWHGARHDYDSDGGMLMT